MFRSYSKNLEDILLHRALYAVENGTYVDIGAGHPIQNSVTKGFYELGWRGLNVEPRVESYRQLVIDRPGDINLCALAVGKSGDAKSFRAEQGLGEHSPNQSDVYKKLLEQSFELTNSDSVSVTLKEVLALLQGRDIHFLKIDAEAAENKVIGSEDFGFNRPWIVVVQVVEGKNDTGDRKSRINELMSSHSYHDVFFDGLNCYYLSTEKLEELAPAFAYPVSVLDRYIRPMSEVEAVQILGEIAELLEFESAEGYQVLERVQALYNDRPSAGDSSRKIIDNLERQVEDLLQASFSRERYLAFLSAQISSLKANLSAYAAQILNSQNEISELRNSTSWKLTSLLRQLRTFASRVRKLIGKLST
jgi:FkbM family methyltransferase